MIRTATETLVVADQSKFMRPSLAVFGERHAATSLITAAEPRPPALGA
jgi:DeoR/GlpR family transcriptional regulator of sugar metabolism